MLHKLNLLLLTVFPFAPIENCFRRGMTDRLGLDSSPAFTFDFNCCFPSKFAKQKATRNKESSGDIFTNKFSFVSFFTFNSYFIVIICYEESASAGSAASSYHV